MYLFLYNFIIYGINFLHFLLYYYLSDYGFSSYNLIFTFLFSLLLASFITVSHRKWWKIISITSVLVIGFIYTINYLYFTVFSTFFNPLNNLNFFNPNSTNFFWQYINGVPLSIYILNLTWMLALITAIVFYKPPYLKIEYISFRQRLQAVTSSNDKRVHYLLYSTFMIAIVLSGTYIYTSFLHNNPNNIWWDKAKQQQDYTIWGNISYENVFLPINNLFQTKTLQAANPKYIEINVKNKNEIAPIDPSTLSQMAQIFYWKDILTEKNKNQLKFTSPSKDKFSENPNIIILQLESVPSWVVELTPSPMSFLKKLIAENYNVQSFFANSCETINAEFSTLCSYYADSSGPISETNPKDDFTCLPDILKDEMDYSTNLYHANMADFWQRNSLAPSFGFENLHLSPEFEIRASDYKVLEKMAADIAAQEKASFNYFVSFTSHSPHDKLYVDLYNNDNGDAADIQIKDYNVPTSIKNSLETDENTINYYLAQLAAVDQSIEHFFTLLDEYDLRKNSIILIHSDHRYYRFSPDDTVKNFYNYNELPMVLITPNSKSATLQKIASHVDLAPTILDLLNYDKEDWPKHFIGNSLFDGNAPNFSLNKCLNQIDYIDRNIIIRGNSQSHLYNYLQINSSEIDPIEYYDILENFINTTDKTLEDKLLLSS